MEASWGGGWEYKEWQPCPAEWSDGATLTIPSVQKSNEGSYYCVISNSAGTQTSNSAKLSVADPPSITTHPQDFKDAVQGKSAKLTVQVTETKPVNYHWQRKPAEEEGGSKEWQPCHVECSDGATLNPSVQKSNGSQASNPVNLSVGEPLTNQPKSLKKVVPGTTVSFTDSPSITTHPQDAIQGKSAKFASTQTSNSAKLSVADSPSITTHPQDFKPVEEEGVSKEWQPCHAEWSDGATLNPSVQKSNGSQASNPVNLSVGEPLTNQPKSLKKVVPGTTVSFTIQATGTEPLSYLWQWKPAEEEREWQPCPAEWCNGATLTIPSVQKSNRGSYCCVVSNYAGSRVSNPVNLSVAEPPRITSHPQELKDAVQRKPTTAKLEVYLQQRELRLSWRECKDMLYRTEHPHLVELEGKVYMGGGSAHSARGDESEVVQVYDAEKNVWDKLPRYRCRYFAMTVINSHLTVVGGEDTYTRKPTDQLAVFHPTFRKWTYPYPPMPTPRYWPAVVIHNNKWLLVAGGYGECDGSPLDTVELFDTSTKHAQWLSASTLPMPFHITTSTILKNDWYLVTGSKQVFRVSLPDIVSQTVDHSIASNSLAPWCRLPNAPLKNSAAITFNELLLTVGGSQPSKKGSYDTSCTEIYLYQPESQQWTKVGDLPNARHCCSCVVLPDSKLLVAGGKRSESFLPYLPTKRVNVTPIQFVS